MKKIYIVVIFILGIFLLAFLVAPLTPFLNSGKRPTPTPVKNQKMLENQRGYEWAQDNDISDVKQCTHGSKDFEQGCINYIQDHVDDALQDTDSRDE